MRLAAPVTRQAELAALVTSLVAGAVSGANEPVSALQPSHMGSRILASRELAVEIMDPASAERYNRGVRFTPVAAVLRAAVGQAEYLANPVEHDPLTAAAGLFAEFDLGPQPPPGFESAKIGEAFLKVGVGFLRKSSDSYRFYEQYELLQAAQTSVEWGRDSARFRQVCAPLAAAGAGPSPHAYELTAALRLKRRTLSVAWSLRNTGEAPFETSQYAHNSILFDGLPVGTDYRLEFPYDLPREWATAKLPDEPWQSAGRDLHFLGPVKKAGNLAVDWPPAYRGPNEATVRCLRNGRSVRLTASRPGERTAVHVSPGMLCPEQFLRLSLAPGKTARWTRTYTFLGP